MLGREIVKGKQHFFIFVQAFAGFWEFDLVTGDELIVGRQSGFASRRQVHFMDQLLRFALSTLRHFIQDIGCLMDPATLLSQIGPYSSCRAIKKPSGRPLIPASAAPRWKDSC
jgi:hypothetical protein